MKYDQNDVPCLTFKPTFSAIKDLLNLENCTFEGLEGVPSQNKLYIDSKNIVLKFSSSYNKYLNKYWKDNLPEYKLKTQTAEYSIPRGASYFEGNLILDPTTPMDLSIVIDEISQNTIIDGEEYYWRYAYPVDNRDWFMKINALPFKDDYESFNNFALLHPDIDNHHMYVSSKRYDTNKLFMFIDSSEPITASEMEHKVMSIITALGIVTGKRYGDYQLRIASKDSEFAQVEGIGLQRLQKTRLCPYRIFDTRRQNVLEMLSMYDYQKYAKDEIDDEKDKVTWFYDDKPMQDDVFGKLANLCYSNNDMMVSASMMLEGSMLSLEYQKPFFHVALETITTALMKNINLKTPPPMDNSEYMNKVYPVLLESLNSISGVSDDARGIYESRLKNNLNNGANEDKLKVAFEKYGYDLTDSDIQAIRKRNITFHGHITDNKKKLSEQRDELFSISMRLHKLCCILLFKASGFSGRILNNEILFGMKEACDRKEHAYIEI